MEKLVNTIIIKGKELESNGRRFTVFSAKIGGNWYKIKFTQSCVNAPKKSGFYKLTINVDECSYQEGDTYTDKNGNVKEGNPTIWVRKIVEVEPTEAPVDREENRKRFSSVFDSSSEVDSDDENLPF